MTTPMNAYIKVAEEYTRKKIKDWSSVVHFFQDTLPNLSSETRKKILDELMSSHDDDLENLPPVKYPDSAPTPKASQEVIDRVRAYKAAKEKKTDLIPYINGRYYEAVGRRKSAKARVRLHKGVGDIVVNNRSINEYFGRETARLIVRQPLELVNLSSVLNVTVSVKGSGTSGQAGAIRLGVARALVELDENLRPVLKKAGFLTRDARAVERKKIGLHKARKRPQYSKR